MAVGISNNRKAVLLNALLGGTALTIPPTLYVALLTDTNSDAQRANGVFTEVTNAIWTDYARVAVPNDATHWPAATTDSSVAAVTKANGTVITFTFAAIVSGLGPTLTGFLLLDSPTLSAAANVIASGPLLSGGGVVVQGNMVSFTIGSLTVAIT